MLIPLLGMAARNMPQPSWPSLSEAESEAIERALAERADAVARRAIELYAGRNAAALAFRLGFWLARDVANKSIMAIVRKDLELRRLIGGAEASRSRG